MNLNLGEEVLEIGDIAFIDGSPYQVNYSRSGSQNYVFVNLVEHSVDYSFSKLDFKVGDAVHRDEFITRIIKKKDLELSYKPK